ncbi:hypothetical protein ACOI1H_21385 [Loktanella sp. DJP18]|uniref:hypothetical protein n=1 Tax=Loktanella sp. DJP18 TaxID=3409788 RepID=UPI003BB64BCD
MKRLKALSMPVLGALGLIFIANIASADLWHNEAVMSRNMTFYTPSELDLSGAAATPAVFVFDDAAVSGADIAARFRLWEYSQEQGFKIVFVGAAIAGSGGNGVPTQDQLFVKMMSRSITDGFVDPRNAFIVGFGSAASRAFQFACDNPGQIRGIVAIDFEGFDTAFTCGDATGLFVLSVHDGTPSALGAGNVGPGRDFTVIDDALSMLGSSGATVQRVALTGADDRYPDIAAKFFDENNVPLDKISAAFIGKVMHK